jgi:hypothetical protein
MDRLLFRRLGWEQYVYQQFGRTNSQAQLRQRQLVLEMSKFDRLLPKAELPRLSAGLVELYHGKTDKTLSRDINAVVKMGLVRRLKGGHVPNKQVIEAFLPELAPSPARSNPPAPAR